MYQITLQKNVLHILPAILALVGMVWGALRLIAARRLKSRFGKTSIDEQQESLQTDIRRIQQLMYSPISFLMSCGILFPLHTLLLMISRVIGILDEFGRASVVEYLLVSSDITEIFILSSSYLIITIFVWALYFFFNHAHRKLILDMCCLAGTE